MVLQTGRRVGARRRAFPLWPGSVNVHHSNARVPRLENKNKNRNRNRNRRVSVFSGNTAQRMGHTCVYPPSLLNQMQSQLVQHQQEHHCVEDDGDSHGELGLLDGLCAAEDVAELEVMRVGIGAFYQRLHREGHSKTWLVQLLQQQRLSLSRNHSHTHSLRQSHLQIIILPKTTLTRAG